MMADRRHRRLFTTPARTRQAKKKEKKEKSIKRCSCVGRNGEKLLTYLVKPTEIPTVVMVPLGERGEVKVWVQYFFFRGDERSEFSDLCKHCQQRQRARAIQPSGG